VDGFAATHRLGPGNTVERNPAALPLAYFARSVTAVADDATVHERLAELDPAAETLVVGLAPEVESDPAARLTITERRPDQLTLTYQTASPNLLRVAIPWFPGWHASVDGRELPMLKVDRAFIGVVVPPGEGEIRLRYQPRFFVWSAATSLLTLLVTVGILARAWLPALHLTRARLGYRAPASRGVGNIGA
jgi:hypothetical protein